MGRDHKGKPSGQNKKEGLGVKPVMSSENLEGSDEMAKKYTKDGDKLQDSVKERHSNRNAHKDDAKNAGGYR